MGAVVPPTVAGNNVVDAKPFVAQVDRAQFSTKANSLFRVFCFSI